VARRIGKKSMGFRTSEAKKKSLTEGNKRDTELLQKAEPSGPGPLWPDS